MRSLFICCGILSAFSSAICTGEPLNSINIEPEPQRLSEIEISDLAPGEFIGTLKGKMQLHVFLETDGTIRGTVDGRQYTGKWYTKEDQFCLQLNVLYVAKAKCAAVYRQGQWLVSYNKKGKPRIRLTKGDSIEYATTVSPPLAE